MAREPEVVGRTEVGRMREVSEDPCTQMEPRQFLSVFRIKSQLQSSGTHWANAHLPQLVTLKII